LMRFPPRAQTRGPGCRQECATHETGDPCVVRRPPRLWSLETAPWLAEVGFDEARTMPAWMSGLWMIPFRGLRARSGHGPVVTLGGARADLQPDSPGMWKALHSGLRRRAAGRQSAWSPLPGPAQHEPLDHLADSVLL